jgi:probable HAF family extracellular repeat protein
MKSRTLMCVSAITLFAALTAPVQLAAQHARYKLIDIGTLGGPSAHGPGNGPGSQLINNAGILAGTAETSTPDPNAPNCANQDCFVSHGFRWQDGLLTDLGVLPGGNFSGANAINARGWIAGFSQNGETDPVTGGPAGHAVLWKDDGIIDLGTLGTGVESITIYIENGGAVVGLSAIDTTFDPFACTGPFCSPTHAFIWKNGVMRDLGTLGGPDSFASGGCNNERNEVVAGNSFTNSIPNAATGFPTMHAFLWENGTMTGIPTLGGTFAVAQCANNRGQVIGQSNLAGDVGCNGSLQFCAQHAFSWNHGTITDLETLGGSFSIAFWLNDKGEAVGGATTPKDALFHATLWKDGVITDLGTLDGDCFSQAWSINSKGQIVGQSFSCDGSTSRTVLWDKGSIIDLNVASTEPLNINDRGEITGVELPAGCSDSNLCGHAFLLIPCDQGSTRGCEDNAGIRARTGSPAISTSATTQSQRRQMTRAFVAQLRARLARRYHIPGLGASPRD